MSHQRHVQLRPPVVSPQRKRVDGVAMPRALGLREYLASSGAMRLVIALTMLGIFLPVVTVRYAFSDDYPVLFIADGLGSNL